MPILINELKLYGCQVTADDDVVTGIGGQVDKTKKLDFADLTGTVQVVSGTSSDTTQQVTVQYRDFTGAQQSEAHTLNGTNPVLFTATMERLLKSFKNALCVGDVAVESQAAVRTGTAQSGGTGTNQIVLDAGASAVDGFFNGMVIRITGGTGLGQIREIVDYVGATKTCTISWAWQTTPDSTSVFRISSGYFFDKSPSEIITIRRVYGIGPLADVPGGATKTYYEKGFFFNQTLSNGTMLTSATVLIAADPTGFDSFGLAAAVGNDTLTNGAGNNRQVAPAGIVFATGVTNVPGTTLGSGSMIAIWMKTSLPAGTPAQKTSWTPRIQGVST